MPLFATNWQLVICEAWHLAELIISHFPWSFFLPLPPLLSCMPPLISVAKSLRVRQLFPPTPLWHVLLISCVSGLGAQPFNFFFSETLSPWNQWDLTYLKLMLWLLRDCGPNSLSKVLLNARKWLRMPFKIFILSPEWFPWFMEISEPNFIFFLTSFLRFLCITKISVQPFLLVLFINIGDLVIGGQCKNNPIPANFLLDKITCTECYRRGSN